MSAFVSWKTSDTNRSIMSDYSGEALFPVAMIAPDGARWVERCYQGFGMFGGQDVFELISRLNSGPGTRAHGAHLIFSQGNVDGNFQTAAARGVLCPKFAENLEAEYDSIPHSAPCPRSGYFPAEES